MAMELRAARGVGAAADEIFRRAFSVGELESASGARKSLMLCCPDEQVERLLKLTGLDETIEILPDRDEAIDALRS